MKRYWIILLCSVSASLCAADFTRYQVILDRMPFGVEAVPAPPPGPGVGPNGKPLPPPDSFTKTLKMCAVTRHALTGRLQVGIVDTASKKNYFLAVGDSEDGITVVDADYDGEKALLRKDGQEVWLGMSDVTSMGGATPAAAPAAASGFRMPMPGTGATPSASVSTARVRESFITAPRPARPLPANQLTGEALQKHLEQYQMDLIRAHGEKGPALPMELTPEMDQQLVKEGVLPPQ